MRDTFSVGRDEKENSSKPYELWYACTSIGVELGRGGEGEAPLAELLPLMTWPS